MKSSRSSKANGCRGAVHSSQQGVHPQLLKTLRRHLEAKWNQPLHRPSVEAFQRLLDAGVLSSGLPVVLDSGCGTGDSSLQLAQRFPGRLVIGVDKSLVRLSKSGLKDGFFQSGKCVLVRAELASFWRLLLESGAALERHFLLYPNPWPKPAHLQRRWHGHPVFPTLLALGGAIELRCNWEVYAQEFALAVSAALGRDIRASRLRHATGISPFEKKYLERRHALYAVEVAAEDAGAFRTACSLQPGFTGPAR